MDAPRILVFLNMSKLFLKSLMFFQIGLCKIISVKLNNPRQFSTRAGSIDVRVPQTRDGEFYPSILERYQRSERAVIMALYEAYVNGVSTRKMKKIAEVLLGKGFS
jgi:hypothetical protein